MRDFAPRLAALPGQTLIADIVGMRAEGARPIFGRHLLQGKLIADYRHSGDGPYFVSTQAGTFRPEAVEPGNCDVEVFRPQLEAAQVRAVPGERFRTSENAVDHTSAALIVSVGRGIKEKEDIGIVEEVREAPGAEIGGVPADLR